MFVSVFDVFKIGVGPSSSHTMGPMLAAASFLELARSRLDGSAGRDLSLGCTLYGSLAYTGEGHGTYRAILAGLCGIVPDQYDRADAETRLGALAKSGAIEITPAVRLSFDSESGIVADRKTRLDAHPNGMRFTITHGTEDVVSETYFSIGGGFVMTAAEMAERDTILVPENDVPYAFSNAVEMLQMGSASGLSIAQMKRANEVSVRPLPEVDEKLGLIWNRMDACIERGLLAGGELPGGLHVRRRAKGLSERLAGQVNANDAPLHMAVDWLSAYAMAVNEENAAGGQVVTAPTNGAAGVIPAVIKYYVMFVPGADPAKVPDMLLTAAAIGGLIKFNASISGAEVGCQGEVGSASAMAAAALCAALGGTNEQIENAAEIALEHHLGMTCDPVRGLVQVPCIERNGMGAVKAVAAASLALAGDGKHFVPLDACIETMRQTGRDMDERYKETSLAGLSVSIPEC